MYYLNECTRREGGEGGSRVLDDTQELAVLCARPLFFSPHSIVCNKNDRKCTRDPIASRLTRRERERERESNENYYIRFESEKYYYFTRMRRFIYTYIYICHARKRVVKFAKFSKVYLTR